MISNESFAAGEVEARALFDQEASERCLEGLEEGYPAFFSDEKRPEELNV